MTEAEIALGREILESGKYSHLAESDRFGVNGAEREISCAPPTFEAVGGNEESLTGAEVLDELMQWWSRFIAVTNPDDVRLLALWTVHTHLVRELYTTPRLLIDSIMEGSGKSTVLDHLQRLCADPVQAASISSPALIPRLLENRMRTVLIDEAHRALRPDKPGVEDLIGIINTGYRYGATRPVLVPTKGGGWDVNEMTTFAPVAMAGNNPNLPADTASRQVRILLMPDINGTVEDSDWELIESQANVLKACIRDWADAVREAIKGLDVALPAGCIGRRKEKWRPLARVAAAAGGDWPAIVHRLIEANMAEEEAEREAGLKTRPAGMVVMSDLRDVWPADDAFVPTRELVAELIAHNPDYWGAGSAYGKALTEHRLGRILSQAAKITSSRPGGRGPRGYLRAQLAPVWLRLGIPLFQSGATGYSGATGADAANCTEKTVCTALKEAPVEEVQCRNCGDELTMPYQIETGICDGCVLKADDAERTANINPEENL